MTSRGAWVVGACDAVEFVVTGDDMSAYASLSGDHNPLHHDAEFARARGFAGPVVYGGLLLGVVSRLLGERLPGPGCVWHSVSMNFRGALYVGEPARCEGRVTYASHDLGVLRLQIEVRAGERLIASGEVQAGLGRTG